LSLIRMEFAAPCSISSRKIAGFSHEDVVTHQLKLAAKAMGQPARALSVTRRHPVLERQHRIAVRDRHQYSTISSGVSDLPSPVSS
jgi:hypothetical protein